MALDKRIIAIQMLPKAYDEIQRLKGEETWTRFIIECVRAKVGNNTILQDELATLLQEAEARKVKTEKPKAEKPKKAAKSEKVEKAEAETKVPSAEEAERVEVEGAGTLIMPHTHKPKKGKTLQEIQAANK